MSLQHRQLGNTDIFVSPIGLGTVKFGRNTSVKYPKAFTIPTEQQIGRLLGTAKDLNINVLDTAPAYGHSEERIGSLLKHQRQDWIIVGKAGEEFEENQSTYHFSRAHILKSVERSLKRLQTDYLDVLLIHSNGEDQRIISEDGVFETLGELKQKGIIRAYGMSTKTVEGGLATLEKADVVMATYHPKYTEERQVLDQANILNKGVFIKKSLNSGHLDNFSEEDPVQASMNFIFKHSSISSVIIGTINPQHLSENVHKAIAAIEA